MFRSVNLELNHPTVKIALNRLKDVNYKIDDENGSKRNVIEFVV